MSIMKLQGAKEASQGVYYEIDPNHEPIGKGGMGIVYRGVRVESNGVRRDAAIKFLYEDLPANAIERARREASIQIKNENLIEMFGFIEINATGSNESIVPHYHVASELLNGIMLYDLIDGNLVDKHGVETPFVQGLYKMMTEDRPHFALKIVKNVLSGLIALHDAGYVHRDIDPSNIMVTGDGKIKLIDFGISKNLNEPVGSQNLTKSGQYIGKPAFSAPELALGDIAHQDRTTDLYAVGIMLFQLVSGHLPFIGSDAEVLDNQIRGKMPLNEIPQKSIRKIIEKATAKKPSDRYKSASEFRVAIEQIENEDFSKPQTLSERITLTATDAIKVPSKSKTPLFICIAAIAVILIGIVPFVVNSVSEKKKAEDLAQQEAAIHEQYLVSLRQSLTDSIADNSSISPLHNEEVNVNVNTIGMLMNQAMQLVRDSLTATQGVDLLKTIAEKKYQNCSSDAAYILGRIHYNKNLSEEQRVIKNNASVADDLSLMAYYDSLSVAIDGTNYKALYERSADLTLPDMERGTLQDQEQALSLAKIALEYANKAGDSSVAERIQRLLSRLEPHD